MKKLKQYIIKEISKLMEKEVTTPQKYEMPPEIQDTLEVDLKMKPLIRFVDKLKAVNTIPPSYRVFLLNGETFDIYYETFSLMIKVQDKEYYIGDLDERNYAIKHINRLLQEPMATPGTEGEEEDTEETPPSPPSSPTPPPPTPPAGATPEPPEEPAEAPAEEPEA